MAKVQGYNKVLKGTTLRMWWNERKMVEIVWNNSDSQLELWVDKKFYGLIGKGDVAFEDITGSPYDNDQLREALEDIESADYLTISDYTGDASIGLPNSNFNASPESGDIPLQVQFTPVDPNLNEYFWDFGNGITSNGVNPIISFYDVGSYNVELRTVNAKGSSTSYKVINATQGVNAPVAGFTLSRYAGYPPFSAEVTDTATGPDLDPNRVWDYGNGTTVVGDLNTVTYYEPGTYTLTQTVNSQYGSDTFSVQVEIYEEGTQIPTASFNASPLTGYAPLDVDFEDTSIDQDGAALFEFGDGFFTSSTSGTHTYSDVGTYTITCTATNTAGSDVATKTVVVDQNPALIADFEADAYSKLFGDTFYFTNTSPIPEPDITKYEWFVLDRYTTYDRDFERQFPTIGDHDVKLTVFTNDGSATVTKTITVLEPTVPPLPNFTFVKTEGTPGWINEVSFTDTSTSAENATYFWEFNGQGSSPEFTSTDQNPIFTFPEATASYDVFLTVTTVTGGTATKGSSINIDEKLTANITKSSDIAEAGRTAVTFNHNSIPDIDSQLWDFGDGTTSMLKYPSKTYSTEGIYTVTVTVTNGDDSVVDTTTIEVVPVQPQVVADGSASTNVGTAPLTVNFTNESTGAIFYEWDFGDGNTSTDENPTHTYTNTGTFNIILVASNYSNQDNALVDAVTVVSDTLPEVSFDVTATTPINGWHKEMQFTNTSNNDDGATYFWEFDINDPSQGTSTDENPIHTYPESFSNITARLTVTNPSGVGTGFSTVFVREVTNPAFAWVQTANPGEIQFTDASTTNTDVSKWSFGDGTSDVINIGLSDALHTYPGPGTYDATLTLETTHGSNSVTRTITVL